MLNLLFMADIGHSREHADRLSNPYPMGKCAVEGSFSLYDGLRDYVVNQGATPSAMVILGDVAYTGGSKLGLNDTRYAFQSYLNGQIPEDRVFVSIGNHDVHYLGCTNVEVRKCYYGDATQGHWISKYSMTHNQWRENWLEAFPGLRKSTISPGNNKWQAPMRYNMNLDPNSSVYFITGLIAGVAQFDWNGDTPSEAVDAEAAHDVECSFLRDSLAHGRRLNKTVFIYLTHHFLPGCNDWSLIQQIDVWLYGHKHNYWQSPDNGNVVVQEQRHYPARILIGNGGFDQGHIDVVSFGHITEELSDDKSRVKLHFKIFDTCVSDETCPSGLTRWTEHCWRKCKSFPGGHDGGGGPRKAVPSIHDYGFTFDAPRVAGKRPMASAPFNGSWKLRVGNGSSSAWLKMYACVGDKTSQCIYPGSDEQTSTEFTFYDATPDRENPSIISARLAVDDDIRAPLVLEKASKEGRLLRPADGFWDVVGHGSGAGLVRPSDGYTFQFRRSAHGWQLLGVAWVESSGAGMGFLAVVNGGFVLDVSFSEARSDLQDIMV